ncbi:hypothetical protein ACFLYB_06470 [Chloroflexota bacterium]
MPKGKDSDKKSTAENFGEMFKAFGNAVSETFRNPELKEKTREFGRSASESTKNLRSLKMRM